MADSTFTPPFFSTFTPPFYSTFTNIPALPHNPYTSSTSYSTPNGYGSAAKLRYYNTYQQQSIHPHSSLYHNPIVYQIRAYQHNSPYPMDFQRSVNELLQASQQYMNELRAIDKQIQASEHSIKATFQEMLESFGDLAQNFLEALKEHLQEELVEDEEVVEDDPAEPQETEMFEVLVPPPKPLVQLAQTGTEAMPSLEEWTSTRNTAGDKKYTIPALRSPPPKPLESDTFTGNYGLSTVVEFLFSHHLAAIPPVVPLDTNPTPASPPKPPDRVSVPPPTLPPPPKPPDRSSLTSLPPSLSFPLIQAIPKKSQPVVHNLICGTQINPTAVQHVVASEPSDPRLSNTGKSQPLAARTNCVLAVQDPIPRNSPADSLTDAHVRLAHTLNAPVVSKESPQPYDWHPFTIYQSQPSTKNTIRVRLFKAIAACHMSPSFATFTTKSTTLHQLAEFSEPAISQCRMAWAKWIHHCHQWTDLGVWFFFFVPEGVATTSYHQPSGCWSCYRIHFLYSVVLAMERFYAGCICIFSVGQNHCCVGVSRTLLGFSYICNPSLASRRLKLHQDVVSRCTIF